MTAPNSPTAPALPARRPARAAARPSAAVGVGLRHSADPPGGRPRRPDLRVVQGGRPRNDRVRIVGGFVVTAMVVGLFGAVTSHVALTQGQFRLERLEAKSAEEQARYDRLRLQVAELESPERVVAAAKIRLGMVAPSGVTYLAPAAPPTAGAAFDSGGQGAPNPTGSSPAWPSAWSAIKPHLATR